MSAASILHRLRRVILGLLIVLWLAAFTLSHLPSDDLPSLHLTDKLLHTIGFFGLSLAFGVTLVAYATARRRRIATLVAGMLVYGAFDELTQPLFGRVGDPIDWLCDAAGTTLAVGVTEVLAAIVSRGRARSGGARSGKTPAAV